MKPHERDGLRTGHEVAPRTGAWIETTALMEPVSGSMSHPARVRGLGSGLGTLPILFDNPLLQRECLTQGINGMHSKDFRLYSAR